jgi:hypothetical protein
MPELDCTFRILTEHGESRTVFSLVAIDPLGEFDVLASLDARELVSQEAA